MSFQDRFKDKANVVGKQGEGAMLVQKPAPPRAPPRKAVHPDDSVRDIGTGPMSRGQTNNSGRTQMSMLPYGGGQRRGSSSTATSNSNAPLSANNGFRDHVRSLAANNDSQQFQQNASGAAMYGRRAQSNQPRVNPLMLKPHDPLKLGKNKFREDVSPRWKDKQREIDEALHAQSIRMEESGNQGTNFTPYTLEDWRRAREELAIVKGGVGRNASDSDEQRLYRMLRGKMKEFGEETEKVNKVLLQEEIARVGAKPIAPIPTEDHLEKTARRHKAIEFAKHVPKPRVNNAGIGQERGDGVEEADRDIEENLFSPEARQKDAELADLEEQHSRDQQAVLALKKKMGM